MVSPSVFPTEFTSESLLESSPPSPNSPPLLRPAQGLESSRPRFFQTPLSSSRPPALAPRSLPTLQGRPPIPICSLRAAGHPPFVSNTSPSSRPERSGDSGRLGGRPSAARLRARRIPAAGPPAQARRVLSGFPRSLCPRGTLARPAPPTPAHPQSPTGRARPSTHGEPGCTNPPPLRTLWAPGRRGTPSRRKTAPLPGGERSRPAPAVPGPTGALPANTNPCEAVRPKEAAAGTFPLVIKKDLWSSVFLVQWAARQSHNLKVLSSSLREGMAFFSFPFACFSLGAFIFLESVFAFICLWDAVCSAVKYQDVRLCQSFLTITVPGPHLAAHSRNGCFSGSSRDAPPWRQWQLSLQISPEKPRSA